MSELKLSVIKDDLEQNLRQLNINPFPIEVFPDLIRKVITETSRVLNYPIDFTGSSILAATSIAVGNTHRIELKKGYQENGTLWCALVGSSGVSKSHPMSFALEPILAKDAESVKRFNQLQLEYKEYLQMDRETKKIHGTIEAPLFKKSILSDYTFESLSAVHDVNRRGIGVFRDEIAGWVKNFGKYSGGSEVESWLSTWSCKPLIIDRKTGDKIFIKEPFVSVLGSIQPEVLDELSYHGGDSNGFIARILFVYPEGLTRHPWNDEELDVGIVNSYRFTIDRLIDIPESSREVLQFEPAARKEMMVWQSELTNRINEAPEPLKIPLSKIDTYALRICLLIQMLRWACNEAGKECVDTQTVKAALKLTEYYIHNSIKVHTYLNSTPLDRLPETTRAWYEQLPDKFKTQEAKELAKKLALPGLSERNVFNLLERKDLFIRMSHGTYKKQYA